MKSLQEAPKKIPRADYDSINPYESKQKVCARVPHAIFEKKYAKRSRLGLGETPKSIGVDLGNVQETQNEIYEHINTCDNKDGHTRMATQGWPSKITDFCG